MPPAARADQGYGRLTDSGGPNEMHSPCPSRCVLGPLPTALEHETCQPIVPPDLTGDQLTGVKRSTGTFRIASGQGQNPRWAGAEPEPLSFPGGAEPQPFFPTPLHESLPTSPPAPPSGETRTCPTGSTSGGASAHSTALALVAEDVVCTAPDAIHPYFAASIVLRGSFAPSPMDRPG